MIIAIASGKGGTGKTFVSTNLFRTLQFFGEKITLIDCDAEEPNDREFITGAEFDCKAVHQHIPVIDTNQCQFCGACEEACNYNAIVFLPMANFINVVDDLCHDCGACSYVCPHGAITEKEKTIGMIRSFRFSETAILIEARTELGVSTSVPVVNKAIKEAEKGELVLLDAPPGISCPFIATVSRVDYILLVTEPTPFGLNDLKLSVETIQQLGKPCGVVINRAGLGDRCVHNWLEEMHIPLLMEIPFETSIARIYSEGRLLVDTDPTYLEKFYNLYKSIIHA